jgi:hypothetical protein
VAGELSIAGAADGVKIAAGELSAVGELAEACAAH